MAIKYWNRINKVMTAVFRVSHCGNLGFNDTTSACRGPLALHRLPSICVCLFISKRNSPRSPSVIEAWKKSQSQSQSQLARTHFLANRDRRGGRGWLHSEARSFAANCNYFKYYLHTFPRQKPQSARRWANWEGVGRADHMTAEPR